MMRNWWRALVCLVVLVILFVVQEGYWTSIVVPSNEPAKPRNRNPPPTTVAMTTHQQVERHTTTQPSNGADALSRRETLEQRVLDDAIVPLLRDTPLPIRIEAPPPLRQTLNDFEATFEDIRETSAEQMSSSDSFLTEETSIANKPKESLFEESSVASNTLALQSTSSASEFDTAIVSVAIGEKARFFARYLLVSFLRNSNFVGPLYLITDSPSYYDDLAGERAAHPESQLRFVVVNYDGDGGGTVGHLELPIIPDDTIVKENKYGIINWVRFSDYKRKRLQIKWLKSKLFELIDSAYQHIIFMDSDILIGTDMTKFMKHAMKSIADPSKVALFTDIGHTGSPYHTGVVIFHRERSEDLIHVWGQNIMGGLHGSDQRAIEAAVIELEIEDKVAFLSVDKKDAFFEFINATWIAEDTVFTFMHTTSYRLTRPDLFHFSNRTAKRYFEKVYNTPWDEWTGETRPLKPKYAEPFLKF